MTSLEAALNLLNQFGTAHWDFAFVMFIETSILFVMIGLLDLTYLRRQRTVIRYAVWSLLLLKLILPTTLPGPLSLVGIQDLDLTELILRLIPAPAQSTLYGLARTLHLPTGTAEPQGMVSVELDDDDETALAALEAKFATALLPHDSIHESHNRFETDPYIFWQSWVLLIWICVVAILLMLLIVRLLQVRQLVRSSTQASQELQSLCLDVHRSLQCGRTNIALRLSHNVDSPAICGFWTPTILIPNSLASAFSQDQLRMVIAHELIHWRRGDLYWNALQLLLQIFYFYNPCVWLTNSLLRRLREYRVDEETVFVTGYSAQSYASTLVDVTTVAHLKRTIPAMSLGIVETQSILAKRVDRILTRKQPSNPRLGWRASLSIILLAIALFPLSGCHRLIGVFGDPDITSKDYVLTDFPEVDSDPRSLAARLEMFDGAADKLLKLEQLPDRRLADRGMATTKLIAAGVTDVAADELVGIIVDANLQPVAGATVDAYSWCQGAETVTDSQGIFRLKELDPTEPPPLLIQKAGYSPRIITGHSTGQKDLIVILGNQTCLEGIVTNAENNPVRGARILASGGAIEYSPGNWSGPIPFETTSADDGSYRLPVCANRYDIKVSALGLGVCRHTGVVVEPNKTVQHPIQLEKGIHFEAMVVDSETGRPFEGFVLHTQSVPAISAHSDANGRLIMDDLFPGVIQFVGGAGDKVISGDTEYWGHGPLGRWWSPDALHIEERLSPMERPASSQHGLWNRHFAFLTYDIRRGMKPVTIVVEQGVSVTGIVTDPDGKPAEGATVGFALSESRKGTHTATGSTRFSVVTDAKGHYRATLPASHDSNYHMIAHDGERHEWRNWANGIAKPMQSKASQTIENIDIQLTVPGIIRGRITSFGKPVSDRNIRSNSFDASENLFYEPQVHSEADGTYELKYVRPGKHYVHADPLYSPIEADPKGFRIVELKAGEVVENVDLEFKGK